MIRVEEASPGGPTTILGRLSSTRAGWEAAREADAADLNRLLEAGGKVEAYVVPLWSNADAPRCIAELKGFDEAQVYAGLVLGEGWEAALGAIAEAEWLGAAFEKADADEAAAFLHACAGLETPVFLDRPNVVEALALAIEDGTPREIAAVLRGETTVEPDAESIAHARALLGA